MKKLNNSFQECCEFIIGCVKTMKMLEDLPQELRELSTFVKTQDYISGFQNSLPLIEQLKDDLGRTQTGIYEFCFFLVP